MAVRDNVRSYRMITTAVEPLPIGPRVRALREAMDLSLRDLGQRTGVSAPMLSQVERGETSPTLAVASRIAGGLDLSLSQLLRLDEGDGVTLVRRSERRAGGARGRGHSYEIWATHEIAPGLIYVDLHMVHEVTSPQAFDALRLAGREVRRPDRTLATADHNVPTDGSKVAAQIADHLSRVQVETLERNCEEFGIPVYSIGSDQIGRAHV